MSTAKSPLKHAGTIKDRLARHGFEPPSRREQEDNLRRIHLYAVEDVKSQEESGALPTVCTENMVEVAPQEDIPLPEIERRQ